MSLYDDLGVSNDASFDDIRSAYRKRVMDCHPDRGGDRAEFERIQNAHDVLADSERRARYDETGETAAAPDNHISELSAIIVSAFDQVLAKAGAKFREQNLIMHTCNALRGHKEGLESSLAKAARDKAKLEELLGRLSFEGSGPDVLSGTLLQRLRHHESGIAAGERRIDLIDQAIAYLGAYDFEWKRAELSETQSEAIDYDAVTFEEFGTGKPDDPRGSKNASQPGGADAAQRFGAGARGKRRRRSQSPGSEQ